MGQKRLAGDFASVTVIRENRKDDRKRNMIKHVLFDLDGTLLPMDQNEFVKYYMPLLAKRFVKYGMEPKALIGIFMQMNLMRQLHLQNRIRAQTRLLNC